MEHASNQLKLGLFILHERIRTLGKVGTPPSMHWYGNPYGKNAAQNYLAIDHLIGSTDIGSAADWILTMMRRKMVKQQTSFRRKNGSHHFNDKKKRCMKSMG